MTVKDNNDIGEGYSRVLGAFTRHEDQINEVFFPNEQRVERGEITPTFLKGYGGPSSEFYRLRYTFQRGDGEEAEHNLMARIYRKVPSTYKGKLRPWTIGSNQYNALRKAGVPEVPKVYLPNGTQGILFLEWINGQTLQERLQGLSEKEVVEKVTGLFKNISLLQVRTTKYVNRIGKNKRGRLFVGRPIEEKAREYFSRTGRGKADDNLVRAYRLIEKGLRGERVVHGDLSPTNMLVDETGEVYFIDPELEEKSGLVDVGSLLAYLGMWFDLREHWDSLALRFKHADLAAIVTDEGASASVSVKSEGVKRGDRKRAQELIDKNAVTSFTIHRDTERDVLFRLYAALFHKTFKILAKNQKTNLYPKECEKRLEEQADAVLERWVSNPEKFGLDGEDVDAVKLIMTGYKPIHIHEDYSNGNSHE